MTPPAYDGRRDLGRGTAFPAGADLPGGLQADDRFYRTDLDLACVYDGTRWLTQQEYSAPVCLYLTQATATTQFLSAVALRTDLAPYITYIVVSANVLTTNNATNYWTIAIKGYNATFTAASTIDSYDTKTATANTWIRAERVPNTSQLPTNAHHISMDVTKTLAPGNLQIICTIYYRLIVT